MPTLSREHRRLLENTVAQARGIAEEGARKALADQYAVHHREPWPHMSKEDCELRNRLRAHGRQLGDRRDERTKEQEIKHLVQACAYEHFALRLNAQFLVQRSERVAVLDAQRDFLDPEFRLGHLVLIELSYGERNTIQSGGNVLHPVEGDQTRPRRHS